MFLSCVMFTFWNSYVMKLLRLETITFSDAMLSDINIVLCYVLSQYHVHHRSSTYADGIYNLRVLFVHWVYWLLFTNVVNKCPTSPEREDQSATGLLLRTYSAGHVSPICFDV